MVVLLSWSPLKGVEGRNGASSENTPVPGFLIQNDASGTPSTASARKASPRTYPTPTATSAISGATPSVGLTAAQFAAKVDAMVDAASAHVAVEIGLADGTTLYQREPESLYDAASLYKLGIMVEVYKERDEGALTFDDPVTLYPGFFDEDDSVYAPDEDEYTDAAVGDLLKNMITSSSNVAAEALLNLVGTEQVNDTMANLGLVNTRILWSPVARDGVGTGTAWVPVDPGKSSAIIPIIARSFSERSLVSPVSSADGAYDLTTAGDMAHLFEQLVSGTVLSPGTSAEMLTLLSHQEINDRIPADLPSGTRVAHKTGDLDALLHDAGVVFAPKGPIVVVIMSDEITDHDATLDLMRQIALLAYEYRS
jgi:beta-lactamase class A